MLFKKIPCKECLVRATCMDTLICHLTGYRGNIRTLNNDLITIKTNVHLEDIERSKVHLLCSFLTLFLYPRVTKISNFRAKRFLNYIKKQAKDNEPSIN